MANNPLVSFADQVTGSSQDDPADVVGSAPVGLTTDDPFTQQPMSQAMYEQFNPPVTVTDDASGDGGGNFNDDAKLDPSQVEAAPSIGVPLDLPGVPGYLPPPPEMQTQGWLQAMADAIDAAHDVGEKLGDMFASTGPEIPMGTLERDTLGVPKVDSAQKQTPQSLAAPAPTDVSTTAAPQKGSGKYITDDPEARRQIVGLARGFVGAGTPYQFGGNTFGGASREGMVQAAYGAAGANDLSAFQGSLTGRSDEIAPDDLRPGDLVTWSSEKSGGPLGNDRVGIFVGNRQIVSATQRAGFHVMVMDNLPGQVKGYRVRKDNGVSLSASNSGAGAAIAAAQATVDAINNIFGGKSKQKKKDDDKKSGGGKKGGGSGGGGGGSVSGFGHGAMNGGGKGGGGKVSGFGHGAMNGGKK